MQALGTHLSEGSGLESLLIPPNRFKDPPISCEQPVALKTRFLQRGISSAVVVLHGVESGYFSQTLTAATRSAVALGLNLA
jgi:hypothetical protein